MKKIFLLIAVVSLCSFQEMIDLPPGAFYQKIMKTPNAVILDVRTKEEAVNGKIPGAVLLNYREDNFDKQISELDKNKIYFVYCGNGVRSDQAIDIMEKQGFTKYYNLVGGFKAWKADGLDYEKDNDKEKEKKKN